MKGSLRAVGAAAAIVLTAVAAVHCGSGSSPDGGGGGGDADATVDGAFDGAPSDAVGGDTSPEGAGGGEGGAIDGGAGDGGGGLPWALPTACGNPTFTKTTVLADDGGGIPFATVTWGGTEAAVAYMRPGQSRGDVYLQRMDRGGSPLGSPITVVQNGAEKTEPLALTSDGKSYLVCWEDSLLSALVRCASIPVGGGAVTNGYVSSGGNTYVSALAFDGTSRALLEQGDVVLLDTNANAIGKSLGGWNARYEHLAARTSGFVMAEAESIGSSPFQIYWQGLNDDGTKAGQEQQLPFTAKNVRALASGDAAEIVIYDTSPGISLVTLAPNAQPHALDSTFGGFAALARAKGSFGAAWVQITGGARYASLSANGAVASTIFDLAFLQNANEATFGMTTVDDGFLIVGTYGFGATYAMSAMHVACP